MSLNAKQVEQLLRPVNPKRVQRDNKGMSHLAAYDVSAHLTRIFGFGGWEKHIRSLDLVCEDGIEKGGRTGWNVTYKCQMTLDIKDPAGNVIWSNDDGATGSASNQPQKGDAHDLALKNAISYALKRCAKDLGDQFGLSLYNKGSMSPLVVRVLSAGDGESDVEKDIAGELHPDSDEMIEMAAPAAERPALREAPAQAAGAAPELSWHDRALEQAANFATADAGRKLWRENVAEHKAGHCTQAERTIVEQMITARLEDLKKADGAVTGTLVEHLDAESPWAAKVDGITSQDEADEALAELEEVARTGKLNGREVAKIRAAIKIRALSFKAAA